MVTQHSPVLTLRYGDVEFTLIPSGGGGHGGQATFEPEQEGGGDEGRRRREESQPPTPRGFLWRLVNFTGTLRVIPAKPEVPVQLEDDASSSSRIATATSAAERTTTDAAAVAVAVAVAAPSGPSAPPSSSSSSSLLTPHPLDKNRSSPRGAAVVSTRKTERTQKRGGGGANNYKKAERGTKKAGSASPAATKNRETKNKRPLDVPSKSEEGDDEKGKPERSKKSRNFFFAPPQRSSGRSGAAAGEASAFAAAPEPQEEPEEEDSQLTTLLGQDEEESRPFPLSQDDEEMDVRDATSENSSSGSSEAPHGNSARAAAAAERGDDENDEGGTDTTSVRGGGGDPSDPSRTEETTIQRIMETAQSQASGTGGLVDGGGAWTTDEGDTSNRSFPTQDSEVRGHDHDDEGDDEGPDRMTASTEALSDVAKTNVEGVDTKGVRPKAAEVSVADVPRVSLGDSPRKARPHDSGSVEPAAATWVDPPPTPTPPPREPPTRVPCPRWGHTFTSIGRHRFVLYGGQTLASLASASPVPVSPTTLNDVMVYDAAERSWFQPYNCQALHRQWHTCTYVPDRQLLVAFGGESCTPSKSSKKKKSMKAGGAAAPPMTPKPGKVKTSDVLTVLDTDLMLWYPPPVTGDVPSGRSGHTATLVDKTQIVVFGGVKGSRWINSLYVLDVDKWNWTQPKVQGVPPKPRSYHSATALSDHRVVVFGGNDAESSFNSVHVLQQVVDDEDDDDDEDDKPKHEGGAPSHDNVDVQKNGAAAPFPRAAGGRKCWRWTNPTCRGTLPSPRTGHTATLLNDQRTICVFGGWDPNAEESSGAPASAVGDGDDDDAHMFSNDSGCCYLLDTVNWTWRKGGSVRHASDLPPSSVHSDVNGGPRRAGHAAAELGNEISQVLVFGGRVPGDRFAGDFQYLSGF